MLIVPDEETDYTMTKDILCVADAPKMTQMGKPSLQDNKMVCPEGTSKVQ